jgi:hypothetical protein
MLVLDVVIKGRKTVNSAENGLIVVGGVVGTMTAKVGWEGEWVTDGDAATLTAQRNEVIALFPDIEIDDITITPEPAA